MPALIIDTETTGFTDPVVPIEIAYQNIVELSHLKIERLTAHFARRYNPGRPIEYGAMAAHHILDSDVVIYPPYTGFVLPAGVQYFIGHGVDYDWEVLGKPDVKRIDTLAIARRLWPDDSKHSLSAMVYRVMANKRQARDLVRTAHSAATDVELVVLVLDYMLGSPELRIVTEDLQMPYPIRDFELLWQLSEECRIPQRFSFGKYGPKKGVRDQGMLYSEAPKSYLQWMLNQDFGEYEVLAVKRVLGLV